MPTKKLPTSKTTKAPAIHFWFGDNQSLLQVELKRWQEEFKKRHPESLVETLERGQENLLPSLQTALANTGLFSQTKLVILFNMAKNQDDVAEYLETALVKLPAGIFVVIIEQTKPKATNQLIKKLKKLTAEDAAMTKEFNWLAPKELEQWIIAKAKVMGSKISSTNANMLAGLVGNNFLQLEQEINKLAANANYKEISYDAISTLVPQTITDDVFAVIDAIGRRDFKQAIKKLEDQFVSDVSPQNLIGTLAWHLRTLWQVRQYLDTHNRATSRQIADDLKIHPYVASKTLAQIPYYSENRLQHLYQELSDLDNKLKSTKLSAPALFSLFISRLASNSLVK